MNEVSGGRKKFIIFNAEKNNEESSNGQTIRLS
jgi:hypothetical protein